MTTLYALSSIKSREVAVAVAVALTYTLVWGGSGLGPPIAGFVQEATDNLGLALMITSTAPLALTIAGLLLIIKRGKA